MFSDAEFDQIPGLRFRPWVGCNYGKQSRFETGVLLLGESHYGGEYDYSRDKTRELTRSFIGGQWRHRFWTGGGQVLLGIPYSEFSRSDAWEHVAFYNYVQEFAAAGPRRAPSGHMWCAAQGPFLGVLEVLRPGFVLVLGMRLWANLPAGRALGPELTVGQERRGTRLYRVGEGISCLAGAIRHPSGGFRWQTWHPWVNAYLRAAHDVGAAG